MMGDAPVLDEAGDNLETERSNVMALSFHDRSVSEIETSFSEHFIPTVKDGEETPVNSDEFSSLEMNLLPSIQHQPSSTTMQKNFEGMFW